MKNLGNTATLRAQSTYENADPHLFAKTVETEVFPFPGAAIGDQPLVSAAALDTGLIIGASPVVTVVDQISVTLCNPTSNSRYFTGLVADVTLIRATGE